MVRKNEYTLNKKVNEPVLKKCGFRRAWRLLYIKTFPV